MMISGVGIISPLYASQIFSAIPGEKYKGYVSCVHFIALVLLVGYLLPSTHASNEETKGVIKKKSDEIVDRNIRIETDSVGAGKSAAAKKTE